MARSKFVGSGRHKEGGFLAVHKQDFEAHRTGGGWRHEADQLDMNPQLARFPSPTVQGTLEQIGTFLDGGVSSFISIGDGFARGDYNVGDPGIPTLEAAFTAALGSTRLQNGGTILLKPGNFEISSTIVLPRGISVMGDLAGTYINNPATNVPIFRIERAQNFYNIGDYPVPNLENVQPTDVNRIFNLVLTDNWENGSGTGNTVAMTSVPMIECQLGSNVEIERVTFLGRTSDGGPTTVTHRGIDYAAGANPGTPTILKVKNCYFDGVNTAIEFNGEEGIKDHIRVEGCRVRTLSGTAGPADYACVAFNLCNAFLVNNHHVADNDNFYSGAAFAVLKSFNPGNSEIQVVIMGNSGGPVDTGNSVRNLLIDSRAGTNTAYRGTITGNSWGVKYNNDWYMTVGDGNNSLGDINGTDAIDVALLRYRENNEGACIIVNPGTYTVTETSNSTQRAKLIGNPRFSQPNLVIDGGSSGGSLGHNAIWVGMELRNLRFTSASGIQSILMYTGSTAGPNRYRVTDCNFEDVNLSIEQTNTGNDDSVEISGCRFYQSPSHDTYSLLLSQESRYIHLTDCLFEGRGYALFIGNSSGSLFANNQKIVIDHCWFDGVVVGLSNYSIEALSPLGAGQSSYIHIENELKRSDVIIKDTKIRKVAEASGGYNLVDPSIADITEFSKWIRIRCKSFMLENTIIAGPYQVINDGGTDYSMPTLYIVATREIQLSNSRVFGSLPVQIVATDNSLENPNDVESDDNEGAFLVVDGCELSMYDIQGAFLTGGYYGSTALAVELEEYEGSYGNSTGSVIITNNSFYATHNSVNSGPAAARNETYTGSDYHTLGVVQVYGAGWSVHFNNNDVNAVFSDIGNSDFDGQSAVVLDMLGDASPGYLLDSIALVNGNKILMRTSWNGGEVDWMSSLHARAQFMTVTGNSIKWSSGNSSGRKYLLRTYSDSGTPDASAVTGNSFYFGSGAPASHMFDFTAGQGMLVDNVFDQASSYVSSYTSNDDWIISRNKGQINTLQIRPYSGQLLSGGIQYWSATADWDGLTYISMAAGPVVGSLNLVVANGDAGRATWVVPLMEFIPHSTQVLAAEIDFDGDNTSDWSSGAIDFSIKRTLTGDATLDVDSADLTSTDSGTLSLPTGSPILSPPWPVDQNLMVLVYFDATATGGNQSLAFSAITVTYRW